MLHKTMLPEPPPPALVPCSIMFLNADIDGTNEERLLRSTWVEKRHMLQSIDFSAVDWFTPVGQVVLAERLADGTLPYVKYLTLRGGTRLVDDLQQIVTQRKIEVIFN